MLQLGANHTLKFTMVIEWVAPHSATLPLLPDFPLPLTAPLNPPNGACMTVQHLVYRHALC